MFVIILGVIFVFGSNTAHIYGIAVCAKEEEEANSKQLQLDGQLILHLQVVGYVSAAFVFVTLSVNNLIYGKTSAQEAAGAGFILLCAVDVCSLFQGL